MGDITVSLFKEANPDDSETGDMIGLSSEDEAEDLSEDEYIGRKYHVKALPAPPPVPPANPDPPVPPIPPPQPQVPVTSIPGANCYAAGGPAGSGPATTRSKSSVFTRTAATYSCTQIC